MKLFLFMLGAALLGGLLVGKALTDAARRGEFLPAAARTRVIP